MFDVDLATASQVITAFVASVFALVKTFGAVIRLFKPKD